MPEVRRVEYQEDPIDGSIHEVKVVTDSNGIQQSVGPVVPESRFPTFDPAKRRYTLARVSQIVWLVAGIIETLIGIRFVLRLIAANPDAVFAQFIYGITGPFLIPFMNLTSDPGIAGAVLEISSLIAIAMYALLAWAIVRITWVLFNKPLHPPVQ